MGNLIRYKTGRALFDLPVCGADSSGQSRSSALKVAKLFCLHLERICITQFCLFCGFLALL